MWNWCEISSIGMACVTIPFRVVNLVLDVNFRIMSYNVPNLLSMEDMVKNNVYISIQNRSISLWKREQTLKWNIIFWSISANLMTWHIQCSHRRNCERSIGPFVTHPSKRWKIFQNWRGAKQFNADLNHTIQIISQQCTVCADNSSKPRRFQLSVGVDNLSFNNTIVV